jgi:ubiquinol-cytochrome c reductase cytochrome b subunit
LHEVGSNNPDGVNIKHKKGSLSESDKTSYEIHEYYTDKYDIADDVVPFFPHIVLKDLVAFSIFLAGFCYIMFFMPEMGGYFLEKPNFEIANPLKTPEHIFPVWYFTPFYAILKAVPDKLFGVITMFAAIAVLFALPWFDRGSVRSWRYRCGFHKVNLLVFAVVFVFLGYLGGTPQENWKIVASQFATIMYFAFFILLLIYSKNEKTKPVPERIPR